MTDVKITFEDINNPFAERIESIVDDYDYSGGFDPEDLEIKNNETSINISFRTSKPFGLEDDIDDNLLEILIDRGQFFSAIYYEYFEHDLDPDESNVSCEIDGINYKVELSKDCDLVKV